MKQQLVNLRSSSCSIKLDAPIKDFQYFSNIIQNNILQQWVEEKKVDKIEDKLSQFISDDYKRIYIIVISVKPAFNLSHKKNRYIMIKIEDVTIIIYQAKPVDYYKIDLSRQIQRKYQTYTEDLSFTLPQLKIKKNFNQLEVQKIDSLVSIIAEIASRNSEDWEIDLIKAIKQSVTSTFQQGFWHVFCAKKICVLANQKETEMFLEFVFSKKQSQYRLLVFQKQGPSFNLYEKIRFKIREIISFTVLLIFFLLLTTCKNQSFTENTIKGQVCSYKQELFGICALILFGLIAQRLIQKKKNKQKSN